MAVPQPRSTCGYSSATFWSTSMACGESKVASKASSPASKAARVASYARLRACAVEERILKQPTIRLRRKASAVAFFALHPSCGSPPGVVVEAVATRTCAILP
eukprot:jgi/Pico_ML_1/52068/g2836.t1